MGRARSNAATTTVVIPNAGTVTPAKPPAGGTVRGPGKGKGAAPAATGSLAPDIVGGLDAMAVILSRNPDRAGGFNALMGKHGLTPDQIASEMAKRGWQVSHEPDSPTPWSARKIEAEAPLNNIQEGVVTSADSALPAPTAEARAEQLAGMSPEQRNLDLYEQAVATVTSEGKASAAILQRKLGLGYNTAIGLLDKMQADGIIGPSTGSGPRQILNQGDLAATPAPAAEVRPGMVDKSAEMRQNENAVLANFGFTDDQIASMTPQQRQLTLDDIRQQATKSFSPKARMEADAAEEKALMEAAAAARAAEDAAANGAPTAAPQADIVQQAVQAAQQASPVARLNAAADAPPLEMPPSSQPGYSPPTYASAFSSEMPGMVESAFAPYPPAAPPPTPRLDNPFGGMMLDPSRVQVSQGPELQPFAYSDPFEFGVGAGMESGVPVRTMPRGGTNAETVRALAAAGRDSPPETPAPQAPSRNRFQFKPAKVDPLGTIRNLPTIGAMAAAVGIPAGLGYGLYRGVAALRNVMNPPPEKMDDETARRILNSPMRRTQFNTPEPQ